MKRCLAMMTALVLALGLSAPAWAEKARTWIDYALSTDIVAYIDGHPIRSYNVSGQTVVVAEDLRQYGFDVIWDGDARLLSVEWSPDKEITADYIPPERTGEIGVRLKPVLFTDIQTYVAGQYVGGFNIDGQTLVHFSDLECFGSVVWDEGARTASLIVGNPKQLALDWYTAYFRQWGSERYARYETPYGTVFFGTHGGTMHGDVTILRLIRENGTQVNLLDQFPAYPVRYWNLTGITLSPDGERIGFFTPVKEILDYAAGIQKDYGTCYCEVELSSGAVTIFYDAPPLENWDIELPAPLPQEEIQLPDTAFELVLTNAGGSVEVTSLEGSLGRAGVRVNQNGIWLVFEWGSAGADGSFGRVFDELNGMGFPAIWDESRKNSPQQRQELAQWLEVKRAGDVAMQGDGVWSQGNGHRDFCFSFDEPIYLRDGDSVTVRVGNLE